MPERPLALVRAIGLVMLFNIRSPDTPNTLTGIPVRGDFGTTLLSLDRDPTGMGCDASLRSILNWSARSAADQGHQASPGRTVQA